MAKKPEKQMEIFLEAGRRMFGLAFVMACFEFIAGIIDNVSFSKTERNRIKEIQQMIDKNL